MVNKMVGKSITTKYGTKSGISFLVVLTFQVIVLIFFSYRKQGFHIDEIFTHNDINASFLRSYSYIGVSYNEWIEPEYFLSLLSVPAENKFSYKSVFLNQVDHVHPPFYYLIMHTIGSFFPDTFSKWLGLTLNIVLFILSSIFLHLVSKRIFPNQNLALLPNIIWGFSAGAISSVIFIRMYVLLTVMVIIFVYSNIVFIANEGSTSALIMVSVFTFLGFLTHYYFLLFLFFWSLFYISYLIIQNKRNQLQRYIFAILGALLLGVLIFPSSIHHILQSGRGRGAINSMFSFSDYIGRLKIFLIQFSIQQFGGLFHGLLIVLACLLIIKIIHKFFQNKTINQSNSKKLNIKKIRIKNYLKLGFLENFSDYHFCLLALTASTILTFSVIAIVSPYLTPRYIYFLYPIISLLTVFFINQISLLYTKKPQIVILGTLTVFAIIIPYTYQRNQIENLNIGYHDILSVAQNYHNYSCLYITDDLWKVQSNLLELSKFEKTFVIKPENLSDQLEGIGADKMSNVGIIVYVESDLNQNDILTEVLKLMQLSSTELIYYQYFSSTYFVH